MPSALSPFVILCALQKLHNRDVKRAGGLGKIGGRGQMDLLAEWVRQLGVPEVMRGLPYVRLGRLWVAAERYAPGLMLTPSVTPRLVRSERFGQDDILATLCS